MDPLLVAAGLAVVAAWRRRNQPTPPALPPPSGNPALTAPIEQPLQLPGLPEVPQSLAPPIPPGVKETIETVGKIVVSAAAGAVAALGAVAAVDELDKALGGDGKGVAAGLTKGALGGTAFAAVTLATLSVLGVIGVTAMTILAVTGIGILISAAVFVIAVGFEDAARLEYGQKGAVADLRKEYDSIVEKLRAEFRLPFRTADGEKTHSETEQERYAVETAIGYMWEFNRIRYESWMRRTWGAGVNRAYHAQFGADRGYFVGLTNAVTGDLEIPPNAWYLAPGGPLVTPPSSKEWVEKYVPVAERLTKAVTIYEPKTVTQYVTQYVDVPAPPPTTSTVLISTARLRTPVTYTTKPTQAIPTTQQAIQIQQTAVVQVPVTVAWPYDATQDQRRDAGRLLAHTVAYAKWMGEAHGVGMDDRAHAQYGIDKGHFSGELGPGGELIRVVDGERRMFSHKEGYMGRVGPAGELLDRVAA